MPSAFLDSNSGSSHAAQMLMKQQQQQEQCGPASRCEMESLVAALTSSITAASSSSGGAESNGVNAQSMAQMCSDVDFVTIIGWSNVL